MFKSSSLSGVNQKKADDLRRRNHIANEPTPGEMLDWLKGVKRGHLLVLVNKTGRPEDAYVSDVGRHFLHVLDAPCPEEAGRFLLLMQGMLSGLVHVPLDVSQAAQNLSGSLADPYATTHGVVWTDTLFNQLTVLVAALERDRQARQDHEGVDLLEQVHSACELMASTDDLDAIPTADGPAPSGAPLHAAPDIVTDLVQAGIGGPPRQARATRATVSLRFLPITRSTTPKGDVSE
ncbi:hypothetical protein [uncultured Hydrogenophaga sp.]|uniref:hypothetical protein n=1 Tax=uncultured Hydrogenophaga sp. TaxID=199683 RepID=UPI00258CA66C|nr:hypothetical protein [uncultured Hydrogenophaga sp.]